MVTQEDALEAQTARWRSRQMVDAPLRGVRTAWSAAPEAAPPRWRLEPAW